MSEKNALPHHLWQTEKGMFQKLPWQDILVLKAPKFDFAPFCGSFFLLLQDSIDNVPEG